MRPKKRDRIYTIFNGPDRDALYDAMKYAFDETSYIDIQFEFGAAYATNFAPQDYAKSLVETRKIRISSITHREGSGHQFTIMGCLEAKILPITKGFSLYSFVIIYDSKRHTGNIRLLD